MSERKDQELTIITKARDLVDETMSRTKKFDKRLRFTLLPIACPACLIAKMMMCMMFPFSPRYLRGGRRFSSSRSGARR